MPYLDWIADPQNAEKVTQVQQYCRCDRTTAATLELLAEMLDEMRSVVEEELTPDEIEAMLEEDAEDDDA